MRRLSSIGRTSAALSGRAGGLVLVACTAYLMTAGCGAFPASPSGGAGESDETAWDSTSPDSGWTSTDPQQDSQSPLTHPAPSGGVDDQVPGMGACVFADGVCRDRFPDICAEQGGQFLGEATSCTETTAPTPSDDVPAIVSESDDNDGDGDRACMDDGALYAGSVSVVPEVVCVGQTIRFRVSGVRDTGGTKATPRGPAKIRAVTPKYTWDLTKPDGSITSGRGSRVRVNALEPGEYQCKFKAKARRECPPPEYVVGTESGFAVKFRVKEVTFVGPVKHITPDNNQGSPYATPHWLDADLDGAADGPGDNRFPVAYTRSTNVALTNVRFDVTGTTLSRTGVPVKGTGPDRDIYKGVGNMAGGELVVAGIMTSTDALPFKVKFYDTYDVEWEVALDGTNFCEAGTSDNPIYITLADPDPKITLFHTVAHLACSVDGARNENKAAKNTWSLFDGPANVTTWDGTPLTYYGTPGGTGCTTTARLLSGHEGQCHSFASLLKDSFEANGMPDIKITLIRPPVGLDKFGVKNIDFSPTPSFPAEPDYKYAEADLDITILGLAGQNTDPPKTKRFNVHYIVHRGTGTEYYDPSYGVTTKGASDYSAHIAAWRRASDGNWREAALSGLELRFDDLPLP